MLVVCNQSARNPENKFVEYFFQLRLKKDVQSDVKCEWNDSANVSNDPDDSFIRIKIVFARAPRVLVHEVVRTRQDVTIM